MDDRSVRIGLATLLALAPLCAARGQTVAEPPEDPAFDAALPPLEETAAPPAASEPAAPPPAVPAPDPAVEVDLAAPLPPITTFDTTPPAESPAQAATGEEQARLRYRLALSGLDEVGLEDRFRDLSALLGNGREAASAAQISARAAEDVKLAERLLRSEGYYDGSVTAAVSPQADRSGVITVTIAAVPGPRYALGSIAVTGAAPEPTRLAEEALGLRVGDPIVAAAIETAEASVALRLPEQGYPFVELGQRDILLDPVTTRGDYSLPVTSGPLSRFGGFRTAGDPVFDPHHIEILSRFDRGEIYDSREVDDLRQALIGTSLFSAVSVEPVRTGQVQPDGTETVDLLVRQTKGPWRTLAASAGYGTGEGIKVQGSWTHRNLFPPEGALSVDAIAGTQQQGLSATFRRSNAGKRDRTVQAGASALLQDFAAFSARTFTLSGSISRASTPIWQKRWTYSLGAELIATDESRFDVARSDRRRNTYFIGAIPLQLGYDASDSLLDPTKGFRITGRFSPEASLRGGTDAYARMLLEGSGYYSVSDALVLAGRVRVGSIVGAARDSIAPSRRLYVGGGGSVRGFGYQQLGPKDANDDPVGGRSLTEFALEARYRFGNFGIVPFIDAGRLGEGSTPSLSGMRYGAGIGGRYYTNFGPMRVDVATPINRRPGESRIALYISIGQAF
ncbi:hypothetical protein CLG96_09870 [Sphingomonas oleivorans]|uniref:Bacterial surface antigen (D15) domain-containing protein n=1 Tax=Sphingomonas oleivorans TaxID=1735121 RepID=A0A2T5FX58_9SPHN|nr:BamA/TamA family outer membrane protein [Sphingomonas oleivorans]PTQ10711.1 hypothetical protein CLG96_09870 [Sphingomonas oleivorans]